MKSQIQTKQNVLAIASNGKLKKQQQPVTATVITGAGGARSKAVVSTTETEKFPQTELSVSDTNNGSANSKSRHRKAIQEVAALNSKFTSSVKIEIEAPSKLMLTTDVEGAITLVSHDDYEAAKVKPKGKRISDLDNDIRTVLDLDRWESLAPLSHRES